MEQLYKYQNGNVAVTLFDDGTKIQEWEGDAKPEYPNSMDVKITNYCDLGCQYCHEMSTKQGKHADTDFLLKLFKDLPKGTELALGGGNPLDHPELVTFLEMLYAMRLVPNMTINVRHVKKHLKLINQLIKFKLIYGLGISIDDDSDLSVIDGIENSANIVYHIIAGVSGISILDKIQSTPVKKALILGYKEVGRGINFYDKKVEDCRKWWFDNLYKYLGKVHLSFDNLAIKQLNVKRFFKQDQWDEIYMGGDGQFTMYISGCDQTYAISSTSSDRFPIERSMVDIFSHVREISKNSL